MARSCAIPDCTRHVKPGKPVCHHHARTSEGKELIRQIRAMAQILAGDPASAYPAPLTNKAPTRAIRRKVESGDFHPLLSRPIAELAERNSLNAEIDKNIAANRIAIYRLLDDFPDAVAMGTGIARLTDNNTELLKLRHRNITDTRTNRGNQS